MKTKNLLISIYIFFNSAFTFAQNISGGDGHSVVICQNGLILATGSNQWAQLGNGTTNNWNYIYSPTLVTSNAIVVACGRFHTLALLNDGTVWAWGWNSSGQLGDGTDTNRYTPIKVIGLNNIIAISAGESHSLALKNDGTVYGWGNNLNGQLGDGTTTTRTTPIQIPGLANIIAVEAGFQHSMVLRNDSTVWVFGFNGSGQLGDGTKTDRYSPIKVVSLNNIIAINGGGSHSLALQNDGSVWAWGSNGSGQLGDGTTIERLSPIKISGLFGIISIYAGGFHSMALDNNGNVWSWGFNFSGQLGDGTTISKTTPSQISSISNVVKINGGDSHSLAVKNDSSLWAWGENQYYQLGDSTTTDRKIPTQIQITCNDTPTTLSCTASISHSTDTFGIIIFNILTATSTGTSPFNYLWSTGDTTESITVSASGNYCVTVTDVNNCVDSVCYYYNDTTTVPCTSEKGFEKIYGGTGIYEQGYSVEQTSDGGFIVAGETNSFGAGNTDMYLIKTNSDGDTLWSKTYGGINGDYATSVLQNTDSGYIVLGTTYFSSTGHIYIVKTDLNGDTLWTKTISNSSIGQCIQPTSDGGYIILGEIDGSSYEVYLIKTDANGGVLWTNTFPYGSVFYSDYGNSVKQTSDGGYIIAGSAYSSGFPSVYVIKTDVNGVLIWSDTYAAGDGESVVQTTDGGFVVVGQSSSSDVQMIKVDANGNMLWIKTFGGTNNDHGYSVQQTIDGGFIVGGTTAIFGTGYLDAYLIKTTSNGTLEWEKTFGGNKNDGFFSVKQIQGEGFIASGFTEKLSNRDVYLVKTNCLGEIIECSTTIYLSTDSFSGNDILTAISSGNSPFTYQWNTGDTTQSITVTAFGNYCVTVTDANNCVATACYFYTLGCDVIYSYQEDSVNLGMVSFYPYPSGTPPFIYNWNFGDGDTSTLENPVHTFAQGNGGSYWTCVEVTDSAGCIAFYCNYVGITDTTATATCQSYFWADFDDVNGTTGEVFFTDYSYADDTIVSWSWDFGDGGSSALQNPSHIFASTGYYNICLTITDASSCTGNYCQTYYIDTAWWSNSPWSSGYDCWTEFVALQDTSFSGLIYLVNLSYGSNLYYSWNFGNGTVVNTQYPFVNFSSFGCYNVCLTVTDTVSGCTSYYCDSVCVDSTGHLRNSNWGISVIATPTPQSIILGVNENVNEKSLISLYPNPTTSELNLKIVLTKSETMQIELIDFTGRIMNTSKVHLKEGINNLGMDLSKYPSGIYFVKINSGNLNYASKVIKVY